MKLRQGWMHLVTLFTALGISSLQVNSQSLNYLITIPQTIRPGQELSVGVSLYGSRQYGPVMLNFRMERDGQELFTHKASVAVGETNSVVLPPLPLNSPSGHYQLNVMGVDDKGTTVFQNNTKISFNNRGLMTFVQTDKAIYKPGQTVKFRVFNLHPTLKHYRGQVDIVVEDPSGNRIQQWLAVSHPSGVVSKELPLCVQPPLGDWVISVTHKELEMETKQTFTVAKYVLPKFEVNIQARSFVAQEENLGVSGTIRAKYTYGKAVSGTAKVTLLCRVRGLCRLGIQCPYDRFQSREVKIVHSNIKVYGIVGFDFSYKEIISRTNGVFPWNMRIEAEVVEDLTGKNAESEMDIHVPNNRIKIEFFNTPNTFKPGLMYTAYVRVTQYDGSPLLAQDRKATLKVLMMQKDEWGTKNEEIKTFIIPLTGFVKMNSRVKQKTVSLSLKATFLSTTMQHYVTLERRSPSNSFVQVTTDSLSAQVDVPMMFTIDSTNKTQNIMYQVLSRGNLVAAGQVTCENYQTQQQVVDKPLNQVACGTFRLLPQALWAPFSKLLVYYIREDGEVVNDGISFAVEGIFGNKVELEWSKLQAAPTDNVSLQVTTGEAQAYVGLVVVDKSVLLLKDGNDITQEKVISEVAQFGNYPIPFYGWGMPRLWLPGGNDAASVFLEAGVIVLTDLKVPTLNPIIYMKDNVLEGIPGAPPLKYTMLVEPGHVRTLFPETWIWDDAVTGTNLFAKFTATVPDTMTSWVASAFSLGPNLGLGLAQRQEMVAFQPFFISLDLPYSIIRGEQFILKVTIFNHLKENKQVLVTMEKSDSWDISTLHHVVDVPSKDGITVTFSLSPRRLGQVPITVKAQSNEAADAITKHLLVKAEGLPMTFSKALLIDVNSANVHSSLKFTFPPNVVAGSETAFVTATGDIMGPSIEGLGKLVKMPYGCGEQNMVNFAPNIYVLQYLDATQQDAKAIRRDALLYMAQGYQRELTFQRQDGSFSAFGDSDKSGSTWLSAFVLKCFTQARTHMYIDPHIVNKTSRWLKRQRISSGEYKEPGRLLDGHLLGSSSGPAALTGFVLIGLLSDPHIDRV
uniref:CD109 molecule n=1 Tax=Eptatretus burgeri TaxID=7764 RepID=A0A8C4QUS9_EPTBU